MKARGQLCQPHYSGFDPYAPRTFSPTCLKCQALLAAGKRTGLEPPPRSRSRGQSAVDGMRSLAAEAIARRLGPAAAREHARAYTRRVKGERDDMKTTTCSCGACAWCDCTKMRIRIRDLEAEREATLTGMRKCAEWATAARTRLNDEADDLLGRLRDAQAELYACRDVIGELLPVVLGGAGWCPHECGHLHCDSDRALVRRARAARIGALAALDEVKP